MTDEPEPCQGEDLTPASGVHNGEPPHSGLGYRVPNEFAETLLHEELQLDRVHISISDVSSLNQCWAILLRSKKGLPSFGHRLHVKSNPECVAVIKT